MFCVAYPRLPVPSFLQPQPFCIDSPGTVDPGCDQLDADRNCWALAVNWAAGLVNLSTRCIERPAGAGQEPTYCDADESNVIPGFRNRCRVPRMTRRFLKD
jgi:hypothetical protein